MIAPFHPRLTISPWKCPHFKVIHRKDPARCDDPHRLWLGLMPNGQLRSCGVAADKRTSYIIKVSLAEALRRYERQLRLYWRRNQRKIERKAA